MNRQLLGYSPDLDLFDDRARSSAASSSTMLEHEASVLEADHTEAATELLEAMGQATLPTAIARMLRDAAVHGGAIDRALEVQLAKLLERTARIALPSPGALGTHDGAARASRFFGVELEGLSPEDQEFESARRFVQFVHAAAGHAAHASPRVPSAVAAWLAASRAAKRFAPGWSAALFTPSTTTTTTTAGRRRALTVRGVHHA